MILYIDTLERKTVPRRAQRPASCRVAICVRHRTVPHLPRMAPGTSQTRDQLQATLGGAYRPEREPGGGGLSPDCQQSPASRRTAPQTYLQLSPVPLPPLGRRQGQPADNWRGRVSADDHGRTGWHGSCAVLGDVAHPRRCGRMCWCAIRRPGLLTPGLGSQIIGGGVIQLLSRPQRASRCSQTPRDHRPSRTSRLSHAGRRYG